MTGYIVTAVLFYVAGKRAERRALRRIARDTLFATEPTDSTPLPGGESMRPN